MVGFADPIPQQRVTVFFRIILMIPHAFVLWILGIVAEVVAVIGWFGALFTGRLPDFAADYLTGYVRWQTRYNAYYLLLTDQYPPFTLEDTNYPVRLLTRPGRLNRLAVFFRLILGIPALIVTSLVGFGLFFFSLFVIWLIVLFTGSMPRAAHQALASCARYFARFYGYILMLTSEYPKGLFGDEESAAGEGFAAPPPPPSAGQAAPAYPAPPAAPAGPGDQTVPPGPGAPTTPMTAPGPGGYPPPAAPYQGGGYQAGAPSGPAPGQDQPAGPYQPAGAYEGAGAYQAAGPYQPGAPGAAGGWPAPGLGGAAGHELRWRLVLSDTAKRLVGLFLGLGVLGLIAYIVIIVVVASGGVSTEVTRQNAINSVQSDNATLSKTLTPLASKTAACQSSQDPLHCITALDRNVGRAFHKFADSVRTTAMPTGSATDAASRLAGASDQAGNVFQKLGTAQTAEQYQSIVSSSNVEQIVGQVGTDYQELGTALNARQ
jgi:Domain of unknown function (DUF4389)